MTTKTVSWVAPDLNEWANPNRGGAITYYVNVSFSDGEQGSIGKEDQAKAEELKGLLEGLLDQEADFGLEDKGKKTKEGKTKWTLKSFPGYEPEPYVPHSGAQEPRRGGRSPETEQFIQERMDRRTALMQATQWAAGLTVPELVEQITKSGVYGIADEMYRWLRQTTSGSVVSSSSTDDHLLSSTTGPDPSVAGDPQSVVRGDSYSTTGAVAGSPAPSSAGEANSPKTDTHREPSTPADSSDPASTPFSGSGTRGEGVDGSQSEREAQETAPSPSHSHSYKTDPNSVGWRVCSCGDRRRRSE